MNTKWWLQAEEGGDGGTGGTGTTGGGTAIPAAPNALDDGNNVPAAKAAPAPAAKPAATTGTADPAPAAKAGDDDGPQLNPDQWREWMADGDEKALTRLQRFQSPRDIFKQNREFERKLSSGEMRIMPKKDASPEEMARWRQEMGVPEKPEDYEFKVDGKDLGLSDEDKAIYGPTLKAAHELGLSQAAVSRMLQAEAETNELMATQRQELDRQIAQDAARRLSADWGKDFELNRNLIKTNLDRAGAGMYDLLINGRLADGTVIGANVDVLNWIAGMERELNPMAEVLPGSSAVTVNSIDEELAQLQDMMKVDRKKYNSGKFSPDMTYEQRYRQLLEAKEKIEKRSSGKA